MCSSGSISPCRLMGCPIRRSSDRCVVPAPRCFSQLPTSFIGTPCLGIHRMPSFLLLLSPVIPTPYHPAPAPGSGTRHGSMRLASRPMTRLLVSVRPSDSGRQTPRYEIGTHAISKGLVVSSLQLLRCKTRSPQGEERISSAPHQHLVASLGVYHPLHPIGKGGWALPMWRCGDSNPVPPACKAGALPSELHPHWWGILDSNQGPQSYQDCALTT